MALLHCWGFDTDNVITHQWDGQGGGAVIDLSGTASRTGIGCCELSSDTGPYKNIPPTGGSSNAYGLCGQTAFYQPGSQTCQRIVTFNRFDNPVENSLCSIGVNGDLSVAVWVRNGNVKAGSSAAGVIVPNTYNVIQWKIFFAASGSAVVYVNGAEVLSLTGIDTIIIGTGTTGAEQFGLGGPGALGGARHDDVVLMDTSGSVNNDILPDLVRVYEWTPNADATPLQWTPSTPGPHYSLVNAIPPSPGTEGVSDNTVGDQDQYRYPIVGVPAIPPASIVYGIEHNMLAEGSGGAVSLGSSINGNVSAGQALGSSAYVGYAFEWNLDPVTNAPFNWSDFPTNRAIGPEITA